MTRETTGNEEQVARDQPSRRKRWLAVGSLAILIAVFCVLVHRIAYAYETPITTLLYASTWIPAVLITWLLSRFGLVEIVIKPGLAWSVFVARRILFGLALGTFLAATAVCLSIALRWGTQVRPTYGQDYSWSLTILVAIAAALISEFGLRAIVQPTMGGILPTLPTGLITGAVMAIGQGQHYQVLPSSMTRALLYVAFTVILCLAISELLAILSETMKSGQWLMSVAVVCTINLGLYGVFNEEDGRWHGMATFAAVAVGFALLAAYLRAVRIETSGRQALVGPLPATSQNMVKSGQIADKPAQFH